MICCLAMDGWTGTNSKLPVLILKDLIICGKDVAWVSFVDVRGEGRRRDTPLNSILFHTVSGLKLHFTTCCNSPEDFPVANNVSL